MFVNTPKRIVYLKPFYIDKYEVSYKDIALKYPRLIPDYFEDDEMSIAVFNISYQQALDFCKSKGGDLPTEDEWIIAASFDTKFHKYPTKFRPEQVLDDIIDVKATLKGINGIYGMLGNVWEMVKSSGDFVLVKGGSFYDYDKKPLLDVRVRNFVLKKDIASRLTIGFRCVYRDKK